MKQPNYYTQALAYLRDYMAYCLGQVKSHINNFYFKNNQRT